MQTADTVSKPPPAPAAPVGQSSLEDLPDLTTLPPETVKQLSADIDAELESIMAAGDQTQAQAMFKKFDKDHSGTLEIKELNALLKSLNFELTGLQYKQYLNMLFKHLDKDQSGTLTWPEFEKFYHKFLASEKVRAKFSQKAVEKMTSLEQKQRARDLFAANDKDGSGQLDEKELSALLRQMLADVTAQMDDAAWTAFVQDVIVRGDKDTNAQWSADEFVNFYLKCLATPEITQQYEQKVLVRFQESSGELVIVDADM